MKKLTTILLSAMLLTLSLTSGVFALGDPVGGSADKADYWKVEVSEITDSSALLVWNPAEDAGYVHSDDAVFNIYDGDVLVKELKLATKENKDGYIYTEKPAEENSENAEEPVGYSYVVNDLDPDTEYELIVEKDEAEEENITSGKTEAFTTDKAQADDSGKTGGDDANVDEDKTDNNTDEGQGEEKTLGVKVSYNISNFKAGTATFDSVPLTWTVSGMPEGGKLTLTAAGINPIDVTGKTGFTVKGLAANKKYDFKLAVMDKNGRELTSATCSATTPAPSATVKASKVTAASAKMILEVSKNYSGGSYNVYMVTGGKTKLVKKGVQASLNTKKTLRFARITVNKLTYAKTYKFYVKDTRTGVKSNTITVKTPVRNVANFRALSTSGAVILKWKKVPRANFYLITWKGGGKKGSIKVKGNKSSFVLPVAGNTDYRFAIRAYKKSFKKSVKAATCKGDAVRTLEYYITFSESRTLYSHDSAEVAAYFPAGTVIRANGYIGGRYTFIHNGRWYNVNRLSTYNAKPAQLNTDRTYTVAEAQSYVNRLGVSSATSYLIWANTYTQKMYVFSGYKGHWKCVQGPWWVATGSVSTPTSTGLTSIRDRDWSGSGSAPYWSICNYFSIHGNIWGSLGYPKSNGCVRNTDDHAYWVITHCPIGTAVYVF